MRRPSQADRILALLRASGTWTPAPALAAISLQYSSRVYELRQRGIRIENRVVVRDGIRFGYYRMALPRNVPKPIAPPRPDLIDRPASLFGDLSPDRSYRE